MESDPHTSRISQYKYEMDHKEPLNDPSAQGTKLNPDKHQQNH